MKRNTLRGSIIGGWYCKKCQKYHAYHTKVSAAHAHLAENSDISESRKQIRDILRKFNADGKLSDEEWNRLSILRDAHAKKQAEILGWQNDN